MLLRDRQQLPQGQKEPMANTFLHAMKRKCLLKFTETSISQVYMPGESVKYMCDKHRSTIYITQSLDIGQA